VCQARPGGHLEFRYFEMDKLLKKQLTTVEQLKERIPGSARQSG
jgi:hypothetical protein